MDVIISDVWQYPLTSVSMALNHLNDDHAEDRQIEVAEQPEQNGVHQSFTVARSLCDR